MSAQSARDISAATLSAVQSWLASLGPEETTTLAAALRAEVDEHDELGDLSEAIAVAPDGTTWSLIVTIEPPTAGAPARRAIIIPVAGEAVDSSWSSIATNEHWWLQRDAQIIGDRLEPTNLPFRFDGEAWEEAEYDYIYGEGDSALSINGTQEQVRLEGLLSYRQPLPHGGPSTIVEIACEGASMSTGDIGTSVRQDADGCCWYELWGLTTTLLGRPADAAERNALVWWALGESLNSVGRISSEVLSPQEVRDLLDSLPGYDPNFSPSAIEVTCRGFSGTAEELIALIPKFSE